MKINKILETIDSILTIGIFQTLIRLSVIILLLYTVGYTIRTSPEATTEAINETLTFSKFLGMALVYWAIRPSLKWIWESEEDEKRK